MTGYLERLASVEKSLGEVADIRFGRNPFNGLELRLIVAASARTGSNFLCQQLRGVGLRAGEYFHSRRLRAVLARTGERLEDHAASLVRRFAYRGGFAVKGAIDVLAVPWCCGEFPANIGAWRFVHLRRRDIVKQAISHVLARHRGEWRSVVMVDDAVAPRYDGHAILASARQLIEVNALWEEVFTDHVIKPLRLWYEDLDADPLAAAKAVARYAGVAAAPVPGRGPPPLERQSGALNADWEARLRAGEPGAVRTLEARWRQLGVW